MEDTNQLEGEMQHNVKQKVDDFARGRYNEHINRTKTWRCLYVYSTYTSQDR